MSDDVILDIDPDDPVVDEREEMVIAALERAQAVETIEMRLMDEAFKMPPELAYWACVRVISNATSGRWDGEDLNTLTAGKVLSRWGYDRTTLA